MRFMLAPLAAALGLAGCGGAQAPSSGAAATTLSIDATGIATSLPGTAQGAVLWLHPTDAAGNLLIGAAGAGGLIARAVTDGAVRADITDVYTDFVALAYGFEAGGAGGTLVVANDRVSSSLRLYGVDASGPALRALPAAPLSVDTEVTGLCLYRSPDSGRYYAFVSGGEGLLQQWEIGASGGKLVRSVALGSGIGACAVDDADRSVYVADEAIGIWRIRAEPESDASDRHLVDRTGDGGAAGEEVKGLAVFNGNLLALIDEGEQLNVYALPEGRLAGSLALSAGADDALGEMEIVWAGSRGADDVLLLADPNTSKGSRWRLTPWSKVVSALKLPTVAEADPRQPPNPVAIVVEPSLETEPVDDHGDAADDIAIWVHPRDPARSLIIGAQKRRGVEVYNLQGRRVQLLADGRMNNVDLRQEIDLGGVKFDIVAGSNRTHRSLSLYAVDAATGRLRDIAAGTIPTGMRDPYGLCMYVSARDGAAYVFINDSDHGEFKQWKLENQGGRVAARVVREFVVGTQAEGCVADDETGALYIAEEDVGLWRYSAEPDGGDTRRQIDATGEAGRLTADAEGVAIYHGANGNGYLVLSNQGADNYVVYRREGDNAYVGTFHVGANDALGIDGASETDGLEVTSRPLGAAYPRGLLVVQDGRNITPLERQNFKLVSWERIAEALQLQ